MSIEITDKDIFLVEGNIRFIYNDCEYEMDVENNNYILCLYKVPDNKIIYLISEIKYKHENYILKYKRYNGCFDIETVKNIEEIRINNLKNYSSKYYSVYDGVLYYSYINNNKFSVSLYPPAKKDKILDFNNIFINLVVPITSSGMDSINHNLYLKEIIIGNKHLRKNKNKYSLIKC